MKNITETQELGWNHFSKSESAVYILDMDFQKK